MAVANLPPPLVRFFQPRPPLIYWPPANEKTRKLVDVKTIHREIVDERENLRPKVYSRGSMTDFMNLLQDEAKRNDIVSTDAVYIQKMIQKEKREQERKERMLLEKQNWNPKQNPNATNDPFKTIFISKLSRKVTEMRLRHECEMIGPVRQIVLVCDRQQKSRGYAFVEFEYERDAKRALRELDGVKLEDKRIVVDVERGRTVPEWIPKRLGGGVEVKREASRPASDAQFRRTSPERRPSAFRRDSYNSRQNDDFDRRDYNRNYNAPRDTYRDNYRDNNCPPRGAPNRDYSQRDSQREIAPPPPYQEVRHDPRDTTYVPVERRPQQHELPPRHRSRSPPPRRYEQDDRRDNRRDYYRR